MVKEKASAPPDMYAKAGDLPRWAHSQVASEASSGCPGCPDVGMEGQNEQASRDDAPNVVLNDFGGHTLHVDEESAPTWEE